MSKNGVKRLSTALAAAVAGVLLLAPTAHAATTAGVQQVQPGSVKAGAQYLQRGLTAVRFDPAVAAAHGFKIITLPDGSQQSVPVNPKDHRKPSPPIKAPRPGSVTPNVTQDTEYGDCGYSFIEGDVVGTHTIYLRSGFGISPDRPTAVGYNWSIALYDDNGVSYQGASGGLEFRSSWSGEWDDLTQYGTSLDDVTDFSDAVLYDGTVCGSYGPFITLYPG